MAVFNVLNLEMFIFLRVMKKVSTSRNEKICGGGFLMRLCQEGEFVQMKFHSDAREVYP